MLSFSSYFAQKKKNWKIVLLFWPWYFSMISSNLNWWNRNLLSWWRLQECQDTTQLSEEVWGTSGELRQNCSTWLLTCTAQQYQETATKRKKTSTRLKIQKKFVCHWRPQICKSSCLDSCLYIILLIWTTYTAVQHVLLATFYAYSTKAIAKILALSLCFLGGKRSCNLFYTHLTFI